VTVSPDTTLWAAIVQDRHVQDGKLFQFKSATKASIEDERDVVQFRLCNDVSLQLPIPQHIFTLDQMKTYTTTELANVSNPSKDGFQGVQFLVLAVHVISIGLDSSQLDSLGNNILGIRAGAYTRATHQMPTSKGNDGTKDEIILSISIITDNLNS
jgi:hypothetical protein